MDVFIAVVRSIEHDSSARRFHTPQDFELLLESGTTGHGLPCFRTRSKEHPIDCALRNVQKMSRSVLTNPQKTYTYF
jgi:hypothetical protein